MLRCRKLPHGLKPQLHLFHSVSVFCFPDLFHVLVSPSRVSSLLFKSFTGVLIWNMLFILFSFFLISPQHPYVSLCYVEHTCFNVLVYWSCDSSTGMYLFVCGRISHCSLGYHRTCCVDQDSPKLSEIPPHTPQYFILGPLYWFWSVNFLSLWTVFLLCCMPDRFWVTARHHKLDLAEYGAVPAHTSILQLCLEYELLKQLLPLSLAF